LWLELEKKYPQRGNYKMKRKMLLLILLGMIFAFSSIVYAAPVVDVIQTPTGFFVPTDAQKYDSPYYRWNGENWDWTHGALGTAYTTATLNISAFDVDWSSSPSGEHDLIQVWNNTGSSWLTLGELAGATDVWSYTTFDLTTAGTDLSDEIAAGLKVQIIIDSTNTGSWAVTLAKSSLSLDGGTIPGPGPGAVPEPATMLLLGSGLVGLAGFARRRFKK
jgi:hypothetical protein